MTASFRHNARERNNFDTTPRHFLVWLLYTVYSVHVKSGGGLFAIPIHDFD